MLKCIFWDNPWVHSVGWGKKFRNHYRRISALITHWRIRLYINRVTVNRVVLLCFCFFLRLYHLENDSALDGVTSAGLIVSDVQLCLCAVNLYGCPQWEDEGSACQALNHRQWDGVAGASRQHMMDERVSLGPCVQPLRDYREMERNTLA